MKRITASLLLMMLTFASVISMMMTSAEAQTENIIFEAQLLASNEVAPVTVVPSEQGAIGLAVVTLTVTRSGGTITAASSRFDVTLNGLASNSVIILSHIHEGAAGVNGPVRVDSGLSPGAPVPASFGASFSRSGLATTPAQAQAIINNPAGFYFNVHTALSPGGVARGQLSVQQTASGFAVPTLSEWGLILMSLLFIATCTFFIVGRGRTAFASESTALENAPVKAVDWRLFVKVALYVEIIIALALVALRAGAVDIFGALASGPVLAYTLHLLIQSARKR
jgi:hypothetical protein